jgi:hypothetical protein
MSEVPEKWKPRLRELALSSDDGGVFIRWSYHDGSTWALILCEGKAKVENIVGWAVVTTQEGPCPFVGAYVDETRRGYGYAEDLVCGLLDFREPLLRQYKHIYAVARLYPKYVDILRDRGYEHLEWD